MRRLLTAAVGRFQVQDQRGNWRRVASAGDATSSDAAAPATAGGPVW
ncbi:hypothetical protein [Micromonospora sp. NPDC023888]